MALIDYFKKDAKRLKKAVRDREPEALARVRVVLHGFDENDTADFAHMSALHVIATEYGFHSWDVLQRAPEEALRAAREARRAAREEHRE